MSEDVGAFPVGSAYVQVDPNAEGFAEALEEQIGEVNLVVTIPVVPDASGLQAGIDDAVAGSKATVVVPVTADPAGLQDSIDAAAKDSGAVVTVPLTADPGDLAAQADAAADSAGEEAGTSFADKFSSVAGQMSLFAPDEGQIVAAAGAAGDVAGAGFGEQMQAAALAYLGGGISFEDYQGLIESAKVAGGEAGEGFAASFTPEAAAAGTTAGLEAGRGLGDAMSAAVSKAVAASSAAWGEIPVAAEDAVQAAVKSTSAAWGAIIPPAETAGTEAGEAAGTGFVSRLASMLSGVTSMFTGMIPAAGTEGTEAGEAAGAGFVSRFAAMVANAIPGITAEIEGEGAAAGAAGGEAAGEGFAARFRSIIMGDISPMEALMGAGFVAVAADMASKFQSAMELVHTQAGVAQSAISGLSGQVETLAGKVGISPDSLAETLYHVESAFQSTGISGQKAMQLVQVAAEGAQTGGANVVDVVNALDAAMVSGIGGISSYQGAMGALNAIVGSGDMKMQDLADAMGTGIMAVAKTFGQNITQVGAALATLGDNNIRGAKAATDLRMAWEAIQQPLTTAGTALHHLGLTSTQLGDTMRSHGLTAALQEFVDHLKASKVPASQWGDYMTEIFGKKAGVGISVLTDQLSRMQGKLPDIEKGAKGFASAWSATQATTSQKLKELESSFETLMIKIGAAVLPAVDKFMTFVTGALPGVERFGGELAKLVKPDLTVFFQGLGGIVRQLGSFWDKEEPVVAKYATTLARLWQPDLKIFFTQLTGVLKELTRDIESVLPDVIKLGAFIAKIAAPVVGLFLTGLGGILKFLLGPLKDVTIAVGLFAAGWVLLNTIMEINPFVAIATALIILVGLIIKYHKQIWDVIVTAWHAIEHFFVSDVGGFFTKTIPGWWDAAIKFLQTKFLKPLEDGFKDSWDWVVDNVWDPVETFFTATLPGWFGDVITFLTNTFVTPFEQGFKGAWTWIVTNVWDPVESFFTKTLPGWFTSAITFLKNNLVTPLENGLKAAWDWVSANVGTPIHDFFTVTLPGWFDAAITFLKSHFVTPFENAFKTAWDWVVSNVWDPVDTFFTKTLVGWFDTARTDIKAVWSGILQDITGFVQKIEQVVSGIIDLPAKILGGASNLVSKGLGAVGLAKGGVIPGYAPGHDSVSAKLSPGEAVLVPEAVRAIGPANINAINARFSGGRSRGGDGYSLGGVVPDPYGGTTRHYADGGMVPGGLSPYQAGAAAGQQYSAMESIGRGGGDGSGMNVTFVYNGTQYPTSEQQQAMLSRLALQIGAM